MSIIDSLEIGMIIRANLPQRGSRLGKIIEIKKDSIVVQTQMGYNWGRHDDGPFETTYEDDSGGLKEWEKSWIVEIVEYPKND